MNKWTIVLLIAVVTMVVVQGAKIDTEKHHDLKLMASRVFESYANDEVQQQPMEIDESQRKEVTKDLKLDDVEEMNLEF